MTDCVQCRDGGPPDDSSVSGGQNPYQSLPRAGFIGYASNGEGDLFRHRDYPGWRVVVGGWYLYIQRRGRIGGRNTWVTVADWDERIYPWNPTPNPIPSGEEVLARIARESSMVP